MGLNVIYSDDRFVMYDVETYEDYTSIADLSSTIWDLWKAEYNYIYLISDKVDGGIYLYVPDNNTFSYKATPKDGDGDVAHYSARNLNAFQKANARVGAFIENLAYNVLEKVGNVCIVKQEKLTTERKTYVILIVDREYVYTSMAAKMNAKMIRAFRDNVDVCRQVEEYIHPDVLAQIYQ